MPPSPVRRQQRESSCVYVTILFRGSATCAGKPAHARVKSSMTTSEIDLRNCPSVTHAMKKIISFLTSVLAKNNTHVKYHKPLRIKELYFFEDIVLLLHL